MATSFSLVPENTNPLVAGFNGTTGPKASSGDINLGNLFTGLLGTLGNVYSSNQAASTAQNIANQQAQASQFRPVGITTRFGRSNFEFGPSGQLVGAGYQAAPDVAAMREALLGISGGSLQQAQQQQDMQNAFRQQAGTLQGLAGSFLPQGYNYAASGQATGLSDMLRGQAAMAAPMGFDAAASPEAKGLFNQLSGFSSQVAPKTYDTTAAAQNYIQKQQALLAPQREQQLAGIRNNLFQRGRSGLATGATTTGMQATNPEMAAYYNALAQQDAQLAANADQIGRQNLQQDINLSAQLGTTALGQLQQSQQQSLQNALARGQFSSQQGLSALQTQQNAEELSRRRLLEGLQTGTGLFGQAANLLGSGYNLQQQALLPFNSAFRNATGVEDQSLNALTQGISLGSPVTAAAQAAALAQARGQTAAQQAVDQRNTNLIGASTKILSDPVSKLINSLFGG